MHGEIDKKLLKKLIVFSNFRLNCLLMQLEITSL